MRRTPLTLSLLGMVSAFALLVVNVNNRSSGNLELQAQVTEESSSSALSVPTYRCFDSDGGKIYDKAGSVVIQHNERGIITTGTDTCFAGDLKEFYCVSASAMGDESHDCGVNGCATGVCNPAPTTASSSVPTNVCPTDAFTCGDGSSVTRDPDHGCQFRACPLTKNTSTTPPEGVSRTTLRQRILRPAAPPAPSSSSQKSLSARCAKLSAARQAKTKGCH